MTVLSRRELHQLIEHPRQPGISLYMPAERTGDTQQNAIRLKNLLGEAESKLAATGADGDEMKHLLDPLKALLADDVFWEHQADGFAAFSSRSLFRSYRLPIEVPELAVVSERFHIKPLISFLSHDALFYVLVVSQDDVRLLQCTRDSVREVTPESLPRSLADALRYDDPEKQLQFHTGTGAGKQDRSVMFHGHAVGKDDTKENISRFLHQVDRGIGEVLHEEQAPMVLAGVDYVRSVYREANTYGTLMGEGLEGNFDNVSATVLQQQAWERVIAPYVQGQLQDALSRYHESAGTGLATQDVEEIVVGAHDGRVGELFVAVGVQVWGSFQASRRAVCLHEEPEPGDEDLLDLAAAQTLVKGGRVYAVEPENIPDGGAVAALFRY
ncbi:MAG: hypothetical protein ACOC58_02390 [Chloroflexota bacterium]